MTMQEDAHEVVLAALEEMRKAIAARINEERLTASGHTAESMRVEETATGGMLVGRQYFQGLQMGRPGGNVPREFASIIRQWIEDKGIQVQPLPYKREGEHKYTPEERGLRAAATAIAHTIHMQGTLQWRKGRYTDVYDSVLRDGVDALKNKLAVNVAQYIANEYPNRRNDI